MVYWADSRDGDSANRVGCLLRDGEYWPMNYARGTHGFRIAADRGHTKGMVNLGLAFETGHGLHQILGRQLSGF
jgi:TPR repeat protein